MQNNTDRDSALGANLHILNMRYTVDHTLHKTGCYCYLQLCLEVIAKGEFREIQNYLHYTTYLKIYEMRLLAKTSSISVKFQLLIYENYSYH